MGEGERRHFIGMCQTHCLLRLKLDFLGQQEV